MSTPTHPTGSHDLSDTYARELEQTVGVLQAGLVGLSPEVGLSVIDVWYDTLKNAERDDLNALANILDELRDQLSGDDLDRPAMGDLLVRLGDGVTSLATRSEDGRLRPTLERLATVLTSLAEELGAEALDTQRPRPGDAR